MITVLFWNFRGKDAAAVDALACLANGIEADLIVLADIRVDVGRIVKSLNSAGATYTSVDPLGIGSKVRHFLRLEATVLQPLRNSDRIDLRRLKLPGRREVLLAAIHYHDRRDNDRIDQLSLARTSYQIVREAEVDRDHTRTILFGDLNMNPFEPGMTDASSGFAAMPTRSLAARHSTPDSPRFYNPSWARLGRELPEPPGTHYYGKGSGPSRLFWHHLDQVLVRPALFDGFADSEFRIITSISVRDGGSIDLIRSTGKHWKIAFSDHLPITFKLEPPMEDRDA